MHDSSAAFHLQEFQPLPCSDMRAVQDRKSPSPHPCSSRYMPRIRQHLTARRRRVAWQPAWQTALRAPSASSLKPRAGGAGRLSWRRAPGGSCPQTGNWVPPAEAQACPIRAAEYLARCREAACISSLKVRITLFLRKLALPYQCAMQCRTPQPALFEDHLCICKSTFCCATKPVPHRPGNVTANKRILCLQIVRFSRHTSVLASLGN